jgi:hypothetical protein
MTDFDPEAIQRHLGKLLTSEQLGKSEAGRRLLTYLVERALRSDTPKELEIAVDVFGKGPSFSGAEDSVVRVAVRSLRQKLAEYYATAGDHDSFQFVIPKGAYRLVVVPATPPAPVALSTSTVATPDVALSREHNSRWRMQSWILAALMAVLVVSLGGNVLQWRREAAPEVDATQAGLRASPLWVDVVSSRRPLTIVLGDLFMFTQVDSRTGRTLTVRDTQINSSEELRAFLAGNPSFAADRGLRYVSMVQKSAAIGMAAILQIVDRPGRHIDVTVEDDLRAEQIRNNDIIYLGPITGLGPLFGYYQAHSRYRFDAAKTSLTDIDAHRTFSSKGELGAERLDYALAAKFVGPSGNSIVVLTSGVRNAGLLQVVRTVTSMDGLHRLETKLRAGAQSVPDSFEALLKVEGFRQTDLSADIIEVNALPNSALR